MDRKCKRSDCEKFPVGGDDWERDLCYKAHTALAQLAADETDAVS